MAPAQFPCSQCIVVDDSRIESHISAQHLDYLPFECTWCKETDQKYLAATKKHMTQHMAIYHNGKNSRYSVSEDNAKEVELKALTMECRRLRRNADAPQIPLSDLKSAFRGLNVLGAATSTGYAAQNGSDQDDDAIPQDQLNSVAKTNRMPSILCKKQRYLADSSANLFRSPKKRRVSLQQQSAGHGPDVSTLLVERSTASQASAYNSDGEQNRTIIKENAKNVRKTPKRQAKLKNDGGMELKVKNSRSDNNDMEELDKSRTQAAPELNVEDDSHWIGGPNANADAEQANPSELSKKEKKDKAPTKPKRQRLNYDALVTNTEMYWGNRDDAPPEILQAIGENYGLSPSASNAFAADGQIDIVEHFPVHVTDLYDPNRFMSHSLLYKKKSGHWKPIAGGDREFVSFRKGFVLKSVEQEHLDAVGSFTRFSL
ncbi:hypothetical protein DdX_20287 [Ditylenchus destructor]|uniref:Uncharacterized protein n=1 Tax=Ditylenchus destructor TaxID=166010 RepID=A0AAD4QTQ2_9BILA|nr:hypothetical protein DdX_20287 [Ditylenchus destructor]